MTKRPDRAALYLRSDGLFDWHVFAANGELLFGSDQGYLHKSDAREAFESRFPDMELDDLAPRDAP